MTRVRSFPFLFLTAFCFTVVDRHSLDAQTTFSPCPGADLRLDVSCTDLGTLPGGTFSDAKAVNNGGQVVGESFNGAALRAFRWTASTGMVDLGSLPGLSRSQAFDINDSGQIVGSAGPELSPRAFLWNPETATMGDLRALSTPFLFGEYATGINDLVQVVGIGFGGGGPFPFIWNPDTRMMEPLVTFLPAAFGGGATKINNLGQVVGDLFRVADIRAFLFSDGDLRELGTLGGVSSFARDINDNGQVVGGSRTAAGDFHAFLWSPTTGDMEDLGTLGGVNSDAHGINNLGQVVGVSDTASGESHAFLWTPTDGMMDLGSIAVSSSASDINDSGQIVGRSSTISGATHATRWVVASAAQRTPVIIIPGIMGTELFRRQIGFDDKIWINLAKALADPEDSFLLSLAVDENGASIFDIRTGSLLRGNPAVPEESDPVDYYGGLIGRLEEEGFREGENLFTLPYDWRLDNTVAAANLATLISQVRTQTGSPTVDVIAHSMGGLVVRRYVAFGRNEINKIVYLGTPHLGAPNAFNALAFDSTLTGHFVEVPHVNVDLLSRLAKGFPSVYQLLPRRPFVTLDDELLSLENTYTSEFISSTHLGRANEFAAILSDDPNILEMKQFAIVSSGIGTLGGLKAFQRDGEICWDPQTTTGDKTVPEYSAREISGTAAEVIYFNPLEHPDVLTIEHANMANSESVGDLVVRILSDEPLRDTGGSFLVPGFSDTPAPPGDILSWFTCSPVQVEITDGLGRRDGIDVVEGNLDQEIPGSSFFRFRGSEGGLLPGEETYRMALSALAPGTFSLFVRSEDARGLITEISFQDIPITEDSVANLELIPDVVTSSLDLDVDGDGATDFVLMPNTPVAAEIYVAVLSHAVEASSLRAGLTQSLLAKLHAAERAISRGNMPAAKGQLTAFIHEMDAQRGKALTEDQAALFTDVAERALESLV